MAKKKKEEKRPRGRPEYEPTEKERYQVKMMTIEGKSQDEIAKFMQMSDRTLRKHFRTELDESKQKVNTLVVQRLMDLIDEGHPASIFFYCKTQMGWRETQKLEHSGPDGGPIELSAVDTPPQETREQWLKRRTKELTDGES